MTPAIKLLEKQGIKHAVHPYDHDSNSEAYGLEAAEKIGVPYAQVFKTLLFYYSIIEKWNIFNSAWNIYAHKF